MDGEALTYTYTTYRYYGNRDENDERIYEPTTRGEHSDIMDSHDAFEQALAYTHHSEAEQRITVTDSDGDSMTWTLCSDGCTWATGYYI